MKTIETIPALVGANHRNLPESVALVAPQRSPLAYKDLQKHLHAIGTQLHALGIGSGDRVAVSLPNGPEMAATFLAVTQVAACAPLNPNYREAECDFYLSDLAPKALIARAGVAEAAQRVARQQGIPVLTLTVNPDCAAGE
ncbi:MAG: AMP-binding protein, partial [Cyanobacteria bacterium J06648_11]